MIWVKSGIQSKNNLRYISINQLSEQSGEPLYKALPFYHAFTGCDYKSSFNRKGKMKPSSEAKSWTSNDFRVCCTLKIYLMTSNQSSSPLCVKCMEERKRTQSIKLVKGSLLQSTNQKRIYFSQPKSSKEVGFKHNATMFQSLTSKSQVVYVWCKYLDKLT